MAAWIQGFIMLPFVQILTKSYKQPSKIKLKYHQVIKFGLKGVPSYVVTSNKFWSRKCNARPPEV